MKIFKVFVALVGAGLAGGCTTPTQSNANAFAAFIAALPGVTAVNVTQKLSTPVFIKDESAGGIETDPTTGLLSITDGQASISVPEFGVTWSLQIAGLKVLASPAQLATAQAIASKPASSAAAVPAVLFPTVPTLTLGPAAAPQPPPAPTPVTVPLTSVAVPASPPAAPLSSPPAPVTASAPASPVAPAAPAAAASKPNPPAPAGKP